MLPVPPRARLLAPLVASLLAGMSSAQDAVLENAKMRLTLDGTDLHVKELHHKVTGATYTSSPTDLWSLRLRDPSQPCPSPDDGSNKFFHGPMRTPTWQIVPTTGSKTLIANWDDEIVGIGDTLDVEVRFVLNDGDELARGTITVTTDMPDLSLWEVRFPQVALDALTTAPGESEYLVAPFRMGKLVDGPRVNQVGFYEDMRYPGQVSMQFLMLFTGEPDTGHSPPITRFGDDVVFFGALDGAGYVKALSYDAPGDGLSHVLAKHYPEDMIVNDNEYDSPYDTVLGIVEGDWFTGATLYRDWALQQEFTSRGLLESATEISAFLRDADWLARFSSPPPIDYQVAVLDEIEGWRNYLNTPDPTRDPANDFVTGANVVYGWNANDQALKAGWPDYRDANGAFINGTQGMLDNGGPNDRFAVYYQPTVIDTASTFYTKAPAVFDNNSDYDECGTPVKDDNTNGGLNCVMNLSSTFYKNLLASRFVDVIGNTAFATGPSGIYSDLTPVKANTFEFSGRNDHPMGGGNYYAQGMRTLYSFARQSILDPDGNPSTNDAIDPDYFIGSEHLNEFFINTFDVQYRNPNRTPHSRRTTTSRSTRSSTTTWC